jgi:hypothetical protein
MSMANSKDELENVFRRVLGLDAGRQGAGALRRLEHTRASISAMSPRAAMRHAPFEAIKSSSARLEAA